MASREQAGLESGLSEAVSDTGVFVIQNPAAGPRHPRRLRRLVEAELAARGVRYEYIYTEEPGHGEDLVARALEHGYRRIMVAGGDGTIREAVFAISGKDAALALLPVGTGNQLAANLGIPKSLRQSIHVALNGRVRKIDLGVVNGRPFASITGAGFDAAIVRPEPRVKRRFGYLAYVHAAALSAFSPKPATFHITVDGEEITVRGIGVEVVNMPGLTAPGLVRPVPLVPDGRMDDGMLDGCVLAAESTLGFVSAVGGILTRRFDQSHRLLCFSGREIVVDAHPPLPTQADGEPLGTTPFEAKVWPEALSVLVPAR